MTPRFQTDADFNHWIVHGLRLREPAIDIQEALAGGLTGRPDPVVLRLASESGRVLVSHDVKTMPRHFARFIQTQSSPGLIMIAQALPVGIAIEELLMIWVASEAHEWTNVIRFLPL